MGTVTVLMEVIMAKYEPELESLLDEMKVDQEREARKAAEVKLMWLVVSAIYSKVESDGYCGIEKGSPTWEVLDEIVNRVEDL